MAITTSAEAFRVAYPEFDEARSSDAVVELWLARALLIHSVNAECVYALVAHLIAVDEADSEDQVGGSGEVTQVQTGPRWTTYSPLAKKPSDGFYTRTKYGRLFLALEGRRPRKAFGVRVF